MTRLETVGMIAGALLALGVTATSAIASVTLPDISVTLGGTYPIQIIGKNTSVTTSLETSGGTEGTGRGETILILTTKLSASSTFTADLTEIEAGDHEACHSPGDARGVVLVSGELHAVQISLSPLQQAVLLLLTALEVECPGGITALVEGNVLASATGIGSEGTELTSFSGALRGEKGKQEISEYYNDGGTKIRAHLESEIGAGFVASDENDSEGIPNTVLGSQMIVITGR
jgi:hypothetical protein